MFDIMEMNMTQVNNDTMPQKHIEFLIQELVKGNTSAMEDLYEACSSSVYGYALSILHNEEDARDVLQDCFVTMYKSAHQYQAKGKPMAWIITITKNLSLQKINERNKQSYLEVEEVESRFVKEERQVESMTLKDALASLSEEEQQIITLHSSGLKHREIASVMKLPLSTVLSKYNRGMKKLREKLEKEENA